MMLEDIAIQYINQSENALRLIHYGIVIAGGVIAGLAHESETEMSRAPYLAYAGLFFFGVRATQLVWFGSMLAMDGGYLWVFMLIDVAVSLAFGYAIGVIAKARSRDAYGHARMAFLAFVPIAAFWLFFTPPKKAVSLQRVPTTRLFSGKLGVLTGVVLLVAGVVLATFIRIELTRMGEEAAIQRSNLAATLREMAAEVVGTHAH